ncbi:hypothetical protein [Trebonia sp.]|uniref:hypothetical protein n=1 Tax=Trebonia sp. TaxID=2767075 RepID=UPI0026253BCB|nr:hypothetical protein [Trebonia sp.]
MTQLAGISAAEWDELCARFATVCESAVDPFEVASALEFEGVSDRTATAEYGLEDVFALARVLYEEIPRQPAEPEPVPDPWPHGPLRLMLHGLLYALPAVCFPAAGGLLAGPGVLPTLVVALLTGWGLSQGLAAIGYHRLGTAGRGQAQRVLRAGLVTGLATVGLVMAVTGHITGGHPAVLCFGAGEGAYMLGACVLLVTGTELWLLVALAPGVAGAAVFLLSGRPPGLEHLTWAALAATPVLACVIALSGRTGPGPVAGRLLVAAELGGAVPAFLLGVVAAGLLTFPVVAGPAGHGGVNLGALVASIPLALSMGVAEWSLLWYRRRTRYLLGVTNNPRWFRRQAHLSLLGALLQYLSGTVVLVCLAIGVAIETGLLRPRHEMMPEIAAYLVLGAAMFLVLLLQAVRVRAVPLAAAAAALGAEVALRQHGLAVQLAVPVALLFVVGSYGLACLGAAVRHA